MLSAKVGGSGGERRGRDIEVSLSFVVRGRNARLVSAREELGLSPREMAKQVGCSYQFYLNYEASAVSPVTRSGEVKSSAKNIAEYHGVSVFHFWPDIFGYLEASIDGYRATANEVECLLGDYTKRAMLPSDELLESVDNKKHLDKLFAVLNPREKEAVIARFGLGNDSEKTPKEVGVILGVTGGRVEQIVRKAIYRMRWETGKHLDQDLSCVCVYSFEGKWKCCEQWKRDLLFERGIGERIERRIRVKKNAEQKESERIFKKYGYRRTEKRRVDIDRSGVSRRHQSVNYLRKIAELHSGARPYSGLYDYE